MGIENIGIQVANGKHKNSESNAIMNVCMHTLFPYIYDDRVI